MNENNLLQQGMEQLYATVKEILANARKRAYSAVNFAMVEGYWLIGQQIVEHEQHGEARADYGKGLLKELAVRLTTEFGKGFDERELRKMRQFYLTFQKRDTLRPELTWSHYRRLISVEDEKARMWYMNEAADSVWSTRQMDRQITTLYYERLLVYRRRVQTDVGINTMTYSSSTYIYSPTNNTNFQSFLRCHHKITSKIYGNVQNFD